MSASKHTHGPWKLDAEPGPHRYVRGPNGCSVCQVNEYAGDHAPENDANARLIVAAPQLLAACKIAADMPDGCSTYLWRVAREALREAIAEAEPSVK